MFGYIRPYKPELKMKDFETYKAIYCGLCHTLGKRYSFIMRMILNYDTTFLAIMQLALATECQGFEKRRCPTRLTKRTCCCITGDVEFSADVGVILFYYKLRDNLRDAGLKKKFLALVLMPFTSLMHRKAARLRPEAEAAIKDYIIAQTQAEQKCAGIDEAAHSTGVMMSTLFVLAAKDRANVRIIERLGYFLGRWVYLIDAADDITADIKSKDFNPFISAYNLDIVGDGIQDDPQIELKVKEDIKKLLNSCVYEICAAFELLSIKRYKEVLENIIYLGLEQTGKSILAGEKLKAI